MTVEREAKAGYGGVLRLEAGPQGSVQVSAWRERKVRVEARVELHAPSERDLDTLATVVTVTVDETPTGVDVATRGPHDKGWMKLAKKFPKELKRMPWRVDYVVWVPESTALTLSVVDGETLVEGVSGLASIVSGKGGVRLANVSGATGVKALAGDVEIATNERSWRGGNLVVVATNGNVRFSAPASFAAVFAMSAGRGIALTAGDERRTFETTAREATGVGGAELQLTASGTIEVTLRDP